MSAGPLRVGDVPIDDLQTDELRSAHDVLADLYARRLPGVYEAMPVEQAVIGLLARLAGPDASVLDVGCGTGRLAPHLAALGLRPTGVDQSEQMVRSARRDNPTVDFEVGDVRDLPAEDASYDAAVCWYSLMYLPPEDRPAAYAELARVLRPGAPVALAFKAGDGTRRRGGERLGLGIGFDIWWHDPVALRQELENAGFTTSFHGGRPAESDELQPQGYLVVRRSAP